MVSGVSLDVNLLDRDESYRRPTISHLSACYYYCIVPCVMLTVQLCFERWRHARVLLLDGLGGGTTVFAVADPLMLDALWVYGRTDCDQPLALMEHWICCIANSPLL